MVVDGAALVWWELVPFPSPLLLGDEGVWCKGTSFRQGAIEAAARERFGVLSGTSETFAWLVREPQNEHDSNACAVYIGTHHVGYLPKELAQSFAAKLEYYATLRWRDGRPVGWTSAICMVNRADDGALLVQVKGSWPSSTPKAKRSSKRKLA